MTAAEYARWVEGYLAAKAGSPLTQEDGERIAAKAREITPTYIPLPPIVTPYVPMPYVPPWTATAGIAGPGLQTILMN